MAMNIPATAPPTPSFRAHSERGVEYGALYLRALYARFFAEYGIDGVIVAYNAGSPRFLPSGAFENQEYLVKVQTAWR